MHNTGICLERIGTAIHFIACATVLANVTKVHYQVCCFFIFCPKQLSLLKFQARDRQVKTITDELKNNTQVRKDKTKRVARKRVRNTQPIGECRLQADPVS